VAKCAYIYGALYRAELGLSGLGCLTEADFLQITASVYMGINRGGHVKVDRLCQSICEADLVTASVNRK